MESDSERRLFQPFASPSLASQAPFQFDHFSTTSTNNFAPSAIRSSALNPELTPPNTESPPYERSSRYGITQSPSPYSHHHAPHGETAPGPMSAGPRKEAMKVWSDRVAMQGNLSTPQLEELRYIIEASDIFMSIRQCLTVGDDLAGQKPRSRRPPNTSLAYLTRLQPLQSSRPDARANHGH